MSCSLVNAHSINDNDNGNFHYMPADVIIKQKKNVIGPYVQTNKNATPNYSQAN